MINKDFIDEIFWILRNYFPPVEGDADPPTDIHSAEFNEEHNKIINCLKNEQFEEVENRTAHLISNLLNKGLHIINYDLTNYTYFYNSIESCLLRAGYEIRDDSIFLNEYTIKTPTQIRNEQEYMLQNDSEPRYDEELKTAKMISHTISSANQGLIVDFAKKLQSYLKYLEIYFEKDDHNIYLEKEFVNLLHEIKIDIQILSFGLHDIPRYSYSRFFPFKSLYFMEPDWGDFINKQLKDFNTSNLNLKSYELSYANASSLIYPLLSKILVYVEDPDDLKELQEYQNPSPKKNQDSLLFFIDEETGNFHIGNTEIKFSRKNTKQYTALKKICENIKDNKITYNDLEKFMSGNDEVLYTNKQIEGYITSIQSKLTASGITDFFKCRSENGEIIITEKYRLKKLRSS